MPASAKRRAAERAIDELRPDVVVGLGTGSTVAFFLEALAGRLSSGALHGIAGIPTSEQTAARARELGIPLTTLEAHPRVDVAVDGADEIDGNLNLLKGGGGALLREKIVAAASDRLVIIAHRAKLVDRLGTRMALPIEVVPFGCPYVMRRLQDWSGRAVVRSAAGGRPFVTDEGNWIVDYRCGPLPDLHDVDVALRRIPGVVEHGLFLGMAACAIIADADGELELRRRPLS